MSENFKLTYSTMFDPPPQMHERFDAALAVWHKQLGRSYPLWIDGRAMDRGPRLQACAPGNRGLTLGEFATASVTEAAAAVDAAHRAFTGWARTPWRERVRLCRAVASEIERRVYDISAAVALEVGKNRMEALGEVQETADLFSWYCDQMEANAGFDRALPNDPLPGVVSRNRSVLKPYGVWSVIAPFNFPFALAGGPVAAALVAGNTVVFKTASDTPLSGWLLLEVLRDAGLPPGVVNLITGSGNEAGRVLVEHAQIAGVTFTGSYDIGMAIVRQFAQGRWPRPCIAEMGGKNAAIVSRHADLDRAAAGIARSAFGLSGQKCSACSRVYVDRALTAAFTERLVSKTTAITVGDPTRRECWMGPVINEAAYQRFARCTEQLRQHGEILIGGTPLTDNGRDRGWYVAPTVARAPRDFKLWREEKFLPLVLVEAVDSTDEAITLANASEYGLTAGFYGAPDEIAGFLERIEAGVTYVNRPQGATTGAWPGYQPFGGWKASGTTGKAIGSFYYLPQYLREQSQTIVD